MTVLEAPLDEINRNATPYPGDMLPVGGTGLCLFAAAFLGVNDAIHMARKDMVVTCVDLDADRLSEMSTLYPEGWEFIVDDAWAFSDLAQCEGWQWDIVSADTFTGDAEERSMESLDVWCSLARKAVTATISNGKESLVQIPDGWRFSIYPRSALASWLVLRR